MSLFSKDELQNLLQEADEEAKLRGLSQSKAKKFTRKKFLEWVDDFTFGLKEQIKVTNALDPALKNERRAKALEDFHYFRTTYFPHYYTLSGKSGLQEHLETIFKRIKGKSLVSVSTAGVLGEKFAVAAPRGFGKSTDVSVVFAIYAIVYDLKHFITLFSDAIELTETLIEAIKAEFEENERLKADFAEACGIGKVWKVGEIVTNNNVKIKGFGSGKRVRGVKHGTYRPDLALIDDLENDTNVKSRKQRDRLEDWLDEAIDNLGSVNGDMDIIYIGTILHRDSVLARKLKLKYWNPKTFRALVTYPLNMDMWEEYAKLYKHESVEAATNYYRLNRVKMDGVYMVLIDSPYAHIVNWGLAPGTWVNFDALKLWVEGKLGVPQSESENVTWLIMKKIQTQGIKPKFFVKKALKSLIGKHGVVSLKRMNVKKHGKWGKRLNKAKNKVNKVIKKINKSAKKVNKSAKKASKIVNKSINTGLKYYKGLRKYK